MIAIPAWHFRCGNRYARSRIRNPRRYIAREKVMNWRPIGAFHGALQASWASCKNKSENDGVLSYIAQRVVND